MRFSTSNCIALGVASRAEAVRVYTEVLGFTVTREGSNWSEIESGALRLFLVEGNDHNPCFDMEVEDVLAARDFLQDKGFRQIDLSPEEVFMEDPFGFRYCLSKADTRLPGEGKIA